MLATVADEDLDGLRTHAEQEAAIRRTLARLSQALVVQWGARGADPAWIVAPDEAARLLVGLTRWQREAGLST